MLANRPSAPAPRRDRQAVPGSEIAAGIERRAASSRRIRMNRTVPDRSRRLRATLCASRRQASGARWPASMNG